MKSIEVEGIINRNERSRWNLKGKTKEREIWRIKKKTNGWRNERNEMKEIEIEEEKK